LDVIDRIGPGGHYLECEHTMRHFHDVWYSNLFDRNTYWKWQESGGKDLAARLQEQTLDRMRHQPAPLPAEAARELDEMARHWQ
jgi:trimethylamine--corrinoid protein Co-methyltransferase